MKKLVSLLLCLSVLITPTSKVLALDATPYAFSYKLLVYGHCLGDRIYVAYEGTVNMNGRLVSTNKFLDPEPPNGYANSVVVYSYTDSYGNLYIPYYSNGQSYLNTLTELPGNHGACPV